MKLLHKYRKLLVKLNDSTQITLKDEIFNESIYSIYSTSDPKLIIKVY